MKITVVTIIDNKKVQTYVGAVSGTLSKEARHELADRFGVVYTDEQEDEDEDGTYVYFREVDLHDSPGNLQLDADRRSLLALTA